MRSRHRRERVERQRRKSRIPRGSWRRPERGGPQILGKHRWREDLPRTTSGVETSGVAALLLALAQRQVPAASLAMPLARNVHGGPPRYQRNLLPRHQSLPPAEPRIAGRKLWQRQGGLRRTCRHPLQRLRPPGPILPVITNGRRHRVCHRSRPPVVPAMSLPPFSLPRRRVSGMRRHRRRA